MVAVTRVGTADLAGKCRASLAQLREEYLITDQAFSWRTSAWPFASRRPLLRPVRSRRGLANQSTSMVSNEGLPSRGFLAITGSRESGRGSRRFRGSWRWFVKVVMAESGLMRLHPSSRNEACVSEGAD